MCGTAPVVYLGSCVSFHIFFFFNYFTGLSFCVVNVGIVCNHFYKIEMFQITYIRLYVIQNVYQSLLLHHHYFVVYSTSAVTVSSGECDTNKRNDCFHKHKLDIAITF